MKNKIKKAVVPFFVSVIMILFIGGYFAHAGTTIHVSAESDTNDSANVEVNGRSYQRSITDLGNGCFKPSTGGNTQICYTKKDNVSAEPTSIPQNNDPSPQQSENVNNNQNGGQCRQVCTSYKTVCE